MGVAFTATLLSVGDQGAAFEFRDIPTVKPGFAQDPAGVGAQLSTNVLPLAKLSPASARRACEIAGYVPVPPSLAATFAQARRDLRRLSALEADGRIDAATAARRRSGVRTTFTCVCREKGVSESDIPALISRLFDQ